MSENTTNNGADVEKKGMDRPKKIKLIICLGCLGVAAVVAIGIMFGAF